MCLRIKSTPWPVSAAVTRGCIAALALIALTGCATGHQGRKVVSDAVDRARQAIPSRAEDFGRLPPTSIKPDASTSSPVGETDGQTDGADLRGLIASALQHNPAVRAAEETARASGERWAQVTSLPDPMVTTKTLPEPIRTAEGDNIFVLGVSQRLPPPEKLDRAGRMALEELHMALEQLRSVRLGVIAGVKRTYVRLYALEKSIAITQANQELLRGLIDVARAKVAAGRRSQSDVLRAQVESSNLQARLISLRQQHATSTARMKDLMGRDASTVLPLPDDLEIRAEAFTAVALLDRAMIANPELNRLRRQICRDREAVALAELAHWPDFTVGLEWMLMEPRSAFEPPINPATGRRPTVSQMSEDGSDNWAINFGFNLPIWKGRIDAALLEARSKLSASEAALRSARNRVQFRVQDALERYRSQRDLATLFRDTIIPQAEQTYHVSRESYSAGSSDFLTLIDNWRKWLAFQIEYHDLVGQIEQSVAELEEAVGAPLSDVETS